MTVSLNLQALVPLAYAVPSFALYLTVIVVILRKFEEPFYRLFAVNGIVDCVAWIVYFSIGRANHAPVFEPLYASIPSNGVVTHALYFLSFYARFAASISAFFLSFNRFSIILFPFTYEKRWTFLLPAAICTIVVLPILLAVDAIRHGGLFTRDDVGYDFYPECPETEARMTLITAIGALLITGSCALMEGTTGVYIFYRRRTAMATSTMSTRGMELSLYFLSLKVFAGGAVTLFVQITFYLMYTQGEMTPERSLFLNTIQMVCVDISFLTDPWLLLAMSKQVRIELQRVLPLRRRSVAGERAFNHRPAAEPSGSAS